MPGECGFSREILYGPFYSKHTRDLRFARRWNDWIAGEEDAEVIGLVKDRIEPWITDTNIRFVLEDGTATIEALGNHYVDVQLTAEQRQLLNDRINPLVRISNKKEVLPVEESGENEGKCVVESVEN